MHILGGGGGGGGEGVGTRRGRGVEAIVEEGGGEGREMRGGWRKNKKERGTIRGEKREEKRKIEGKRHDNRMLGPMYVRTPQLIKKQFAARNVSLFHNVLHNVTQCN